MEKQREQPTRRSQSSTAPRPVNEWEWGEARERAVTGQERIWMKLRRSEKNIVGSGCSYEYLALAEAVVARQGSKARAAESGAIADSCWDRSSGARADGGSSRAGIEGSERQKSSQAGSDYLFRASISWGLAGRRRREICSDWKQARLWRQRTDSAAQGHGPAGAGGSWQYAHPATGARAVSDCPASSATAGRGFRQALLDRYRLSAAEGSR